MTPKQVAIKNILTRNNDMDEYSANKLQKNNQNPKTNATVFWFHRPTPLDETQTQLNLSLGFGNFFVVFLHYIHPYYYFVLR